MRIKDFEEAIDAIKIGGITGPTIIEMRIRHSDVTKVIGELSGKENWLVTWDCYGKASVMKKPEDYEQERLADIMAEGLWNPCPDLDLFPKMQIEALSVEDVCKKNNIYEHVGIKAGKVIQKSIFRDLIYIMSESSDEELRERLIDYMRNAEG